jgi:hypothetical protein
MPKARSLIDKAKSHKKKGTAVTFSADELSALARYVSAGVVLLQTPHPVIAKLKGALTRIGLPVPHGL